MSAFRRIGNGIPGVKQFYSICVENIYTSRLGWDTKKIENKTRLSREKGEGYQNGLRAIELLVGKWLGNRNGMRNV